MRSRFAVLLSSVLALTCAAAADATSTIFVPITPCRIADTRVAGGPIGGGTNRSFKVVGSVDLTAQGGASATGCGLPAFNGVVAQVQSIAVNIAATNATGAGYLTAFAGDTSRPSTSTLNYGTALATIANEVVLPVRQTAPAGNDIKVFASTTTNVFLDVTGYFTDITLVDGAGSGLDADTVDGLHASDLGDITGVVAGRGLTGGGTSGNVTLAVALPFSTTGVDNLGIGEGTLQTTTGRGNTALGSFALLDNTTGSYNTALGLLTLESNIAGAGNSAVGVRALYSNRTGSDNTALGAGAMYSSYTGDRNVAIGAGALVNNVDGNRNIAVGLEAGYNLSTGSDNIDIGNVAVSSENSTIRIGSAVARLPYTGSQTRTFIAGIRGVTTGMADAQPVVIDSAGQLGTGGGTAGDITGVSAGTGLTGGGTSGDVTLSLNLAASNTWTGNTVFNPVSGFALETGSGKDINLGGNMKKGGVVFIQSDGSGNLGVGLQALEHNTASRNTAEGEFALFSNTSGFGGTASGYHALVANTTGSSHVALGDSALYSNTTGGKNTAGGAFALYSNTSGSSNIAFGYKAGSNLTTGDNNIDIGNPGVADEAATIRIGTAGTQTKTFIAGIRDVTTGVADSIPVCIDSTGQLGTGSCAAGPVSIGGMAAAKVAVIAPELVAYGRDGRPGTVTYEALESFLLDELQRVRQQLGVAEVGLATERQARAADRAELTRLEARVEEAAAEHSRQVAALLDRLAVIEERAGVGQPKLVQAVATRAKR